jgi:hypothetical protein
LQVRFYSTRAGGLVDLRGRADAALRAAGPGEATTASPCRPAAVARTSCEFCASSILLTPKYKTKPPEKVIAEIRAIKRGSGRGRSSSSPTTTASCTAARQGK